MLIKEPWGIEIALFWLMRRTHSQLSLWNLCDRDSREFALNCSQNIVSDTNKHFKFDLDRKLKSLLKFEPYLLTWLQNGKIEKTTAYLLFSLFIQNQISLFSRKAYDKFIKVTGKKRWGAQARWWAIAIFQLTELNIKTNSPCFQYARAQERAKWRHKSCAERMGDAIVRSHLKVAEYSF